MTVIGSMTRNLRAALLFSFGLFPVLATPASADCHITSCRGGGNIVKCWKAMQREAHAKRRGCTRLELSTGYSAYAMATSLPGVCIRRSAAIHIHRPYRKGLAAAPVGSAPHNFYFGRIRPAALRFFKGQNGMHRNGYQNAALMVAVPATHTGVPICR